MTEIDRIEDQLRKSVEAGAWHGPSLNELLNDVTPAEAAAAPVKGAHSIWEITLHVTITLQLVLERLEGKPAAYSGQQDWPPVGDPTNAAWSSAIRSLNDTATRLRGAMLQVNAARLEEPIGEGFSSIYVTLHGTVQHNLYHAGQIALLKKTIRYA
jgi:uncharacterized damage-inducible protein DinB